MPPREAEQSAADAAEAPTLEPPPAVAEASTSEPTPAVPAPGPEATTELADASVVEVPAGRGCTSHGCSGNGTCDADSGECFCHYEHTGARCDVPAVPSCQLTPTYRIPCGHRASARARAALPTVLGTILSVLQSG